QRCRLLNMQNHPQEPAPGPVVAGLVRGRGGCCCWPAAPGGGAGGGPPGGVGGLVRGLRRGGGLAEVGGGGGGGAGGGGVGCLERGVVTTRQKETVRLLADALGLAGPVRAGFEAAARGRAAAGGVAAATRTLPRDIASFTGRARELEQLAEAAAGAGGVVG